MKKIILWCTLIICMCIYSNDLSAQRFGKNKKQYKIYDWKYIESPHFDVYYDAGGKVLADFAAIALENALQSIQQTLNYKITARIIVVVYGSHNDFQQTNVLSGYLSQGIGGVTELYKNRVVVPFQGSYEMFRHILHHELVHAVINDMFYGGTFQTAITSGVAEIPLWINEGLAEWESLGGMDVATDMFMRDLTINESLPDLKYISGYLAYRAGQTFWNYVATRYGKNKITEFMTKLRILKSLDATFKSTFGLDVDEFSDEWKTAVKRIYLPDINTYKMPKEFAIPLTNHTKDNCYYYSSPAISPNGEKMAFISDKDGGVFAIYTADVKQYDDKTFEPKKIISSARQLDFEQLNVLTPSISWSPDGKKIVISAKSGGEDAIYLVDSENGDYEKILPGFSSITSVNWSPDGNKIVFVAIKYSQSDIYYYDLNKKEVVALTHDVFTDFYPVWSSSSKSVYFISDRGEILISNDSSSKYKIWKHNYHQSDVYKITLDNKNIERITSTPNIVKTCISISADESKMLMVANTNGISNIYSTILKNATNTVLYPITNSANGITHISNTPDGFNLIFCSQTNGGYDIFLLRNPYEKKIDIETLPFTNHMKFLIDKDSIVSNAEQIDNQDTIVPIYYGKFKTDFSQQQFIRPNEDVVQTITTNDINVSQLDSIPERNYEVKLSLDAFIINPAVSTYYGVQGNTAALFSDIMGNHQIYLSAYFLSSLENSQFFGAYQYNTQLIDYSFALYNNSIYTYNWVDDIVIDGILRPGDYVYAYRATGAILGMSYPFSLFRRIDFNLNLVNAAKRNSDYPTYESVNKFLFVPEIQYTLDNSLNGIYAPTRGSRLFVKALYSPKIGNISSDFFTMLTDARHYFELYPNFMSIAIRGSAGVSLGKNPQRFYLGGTDNWINANYLSGNFDLSEPEDFAFLNNFIMPLRGWPVFVHNGTKFAVANLEYRFPLLMALAPGGLPLMLQALMGNVFFDIGASWTNTNEFRISYIDSQSQKRLPQDLYMSAGWGLRAILMGLPLRFDMAWRNEYNGWSSPYYLISLGIDW